MRDIRQRKTSAFEKLLPSAVNASVALTISFPFLIVFGFGNTWKFSIIAIFFLVSIMFMLFNKNRDLGMILTKTYWEKGYPKRQQLLYNFLYALSFSTLFFYIRFHFDVFILNILLLQLPTIFLTGTTLHGYLSGGMTTVKK